jgi:hypothetical protein
MNAVIAAEAEPLANQAHLYSFAEPAANKAPLPRKAADASILTVDDTE